MAEDLRTRVRRKALLGWIPTALVAVAIVVIVVLVIAFNNSWWVDDKPVASTSQQAPDGMSLFGQAGQDYANRTGLVLIKIRSDSTPATALGLPKTGSTDVAFLAPLEVRLLGPDGALNVDLVDSVTITTSQDKVTAITLVYAGNGSYGDSIAYLRHLSDNVGWTDADFDKLTNDLTAAQSLSSTDTYSATLTARDLLGIAVSATVTIGMNATYAINAKSLG